MLRKDPLVHFLVIGGLLFAFLSWMGAEPPPERIVISADRVAELSRSAALLQGRPPTEAELERLVEEAIREEVYYRRALALGLDVDDDEVRRRLIEKMAYVTENVADPEPPEADLRAYFEQNAERFRIPELVTFDQVFFSPRMRGDTVLADAQAALAELRGGGDPAGNGDSTPLAGRFDDADADRVRVLFGEALTAAVFAAEPGDWIGPYESDFGWHLVRVSARSAARDPAFAEVEAQVRSDFAAARLEQANQAAFDAMRAYFDIAVQWESGAPAETWP
jgi:parvulin-like peptidyl-prolyl isomerase